MHGTLGWRVRRLQRCHYPPDEGQLYSREGASSEVIFAFQNINLLCKRQLEVACWAFLRPARAGAALGAGLLGSTRPNARPKIQLSADDGSSLQSCREAQGPGAIFLESAFLWPSFERLRKNRGREGFGAPPIVGPGLFVASGDRCPPHNHRQAARQRRGGLRVPGRDRPPRRSDREEGILKAAGMAALALGLQGYAGINLVVGGLPRIVDVNHHLLRLAGRMMASIPFSTSSTKTHPSTIFPSFCTW